MILEFLKKVEQTDMYPGLAFSAFMILHVFQHLFVNFAFYAWCFICLFIIKLSIISFFYLLCLHLRERHFWSDWADSKLELRFLRSNVWVGSLGTGPPCPLGISCQ